MGKNVFLMVTGFDRNGDTVTDAEKEQLKKDVKLLGMVLPWATGSMAEMEEVRSMAHTALEQWRREEEEARSRTDEKKRIMREIADELKTREETLSILGTGNN